MRPLFGIHSFHTRKSCLLLIAKSKTLGYYLMEMKAVIAVKQEHYISALIVSGRDLIAYDS